ncbi:MAG: hypothetical protein WCT48_04865 [Candidatus Paceibacterota bacterium]
MNRKKIAGALLFSFLFSFFFLGGGDTAHAATKYPFQVLVPTSEMRTPLVEDKDLDSCILALFDDNGQCSWDSIAWLVARGLVKAEFSGMMNMVKSGFFGDTAFLTDPDGYYRGVNDETIRDFMLNFDETNMLPSVRSKVKSKILQEQYSTYQDELELGMDFPGGDAGLEAFKNDWFACPTGNGWDCYRALEEPKNDSFIAQNITEVGLAKVQKENLTQSSDEITSGSGYFNLKENCEKDDYHWVGCSAYTPGATVEQQANEYLMGSYVGLLTSDELDETTFEVISGLWDIITSWLGDQHLINI